MGQSQQALDGVDFSDLIASKVVDWESVAPLGAPISDITTFSPAAGAQYGTFTVQYRKYEQGTIVASDAYGAVVMPTKLFDKWLALQGDTDYYGDNVTSVLGLPIEDWSYFGGWLAVKFERGMIIDPELSASSPGPLAIYGSIYKRYMETASDDGHANVELGSPLDQEYNSANLGRYQSFQAGEIYWEYQPQFDDAGYPIQYPNVDAFEMVQGPIWNAWMSGGRGESPYRYPTSGPYALVDAQGQSVGTAQNFQFGNFYQDLAGNVIVVSGSALDKYSRIGGPTGYPNLASLSPVQYPDQPAIMNGWMGLPTGGQSVTDNGTFYQPFQNGVLASPDGGVTYQAFMNPTFHVGLLSTTWPECHYQGEPGCGQFFPDWILFVEQQVKQDPNEPGAFNVLYPPSLTYGLGHFSSTDAQDYHLLPTFAPDVNYKIDYEATYYADGSAFPDGVETFYNLDNLWNRNVSSIHSITDSKGNRVDAEYEIQSHEPYNPTDPLTTEWWSFHNWNTEHLSKEQYTATYSDAALGNDDLDDLFYNTVYKALAKKGECFGMDLLAIDNKRGAGDRPEPIFDATTDLADGQPLDTSTEHPDIIYDVGVKHGYQLGAAAVNYYLNVIDAGNNHNPNVEFNFGASLQGHGEPSIVSITADELFKYGHSVLALNYESGSACEAPFAGSQHCSKIHIENPNTPAGFLDAHGLSHDQYILIDNDNNQFHYYDPSSTHEFDGDRSAKHGSLVVTPYSLLANKQRTPIGQLGHLISEGIKFIVGDNGTVTQVSDSDGNTLFDTEGAALWSHVQLGHNNLLHVAPIPLSDDSTLQFFAGHHLVGRTVTYSVTASPDAPSGSSYQAFFGSRRQSATLTVPATSGAADQVTVSDIDTDVQKFKVLVPAGGVRKAVSLTLMGTNHEMWSELDNLTLQPSQSVQLWVEKGGRHLVILNDGVATSAALHVRQGAAFTPVDAGVVSIPNGQTVVDVPSAEPFTPESLNPLGWYVADPNDVSIDNGVEYWQDHRVSLGESGAGPTAQQPFYYGRPEFENLWAGSQPTLVFSGNQLMRVDDWQGAPAGNTGFTILAVMQAQTVQDSAVAGFWGSNGEGVTWAGIAPQSGQNLLNLTRTDAWGETQMLTGTLNLGTQPHVVAWRFSPDTQELSLSVDGVNTSSAPMPPLHDMAQMPFIIGAKSLLPTNLFNGYLSELMLVPSSITDSQVLSYAAYARTRWNGLPNPVSGPCIDSTGTAAPQGTRCDDGNSATYGDQCMNGVCAGTVPPPGSPAELSPVVWYHAGTSEVVQSDDHSISTWYDRTTNHRDLTQSFVPGRPTLDLSFNGGKPAVQFAGSQLLRHDAWTGLPMGNDAEFTVLAVMQAASGQDASVASWWNGNGYGSVRCNVENSGGTSLLELFREDDWGTPDDFQGSVSLSPDPHVVVWRYSQSRVQVTVGSGTSYRDGTIDLGNMTPDAFLVGGTSYEPTGLFSGDIAELAVVPGSITQAQLDAYRAYVQTEWNVAQ